MKELYLCCFFGDINEDCTFLVSEVVKIYYEEAGVLLVRDDLLKQKQCWNQIEYFYKHFIWGR
jgi:hypothetical protein